MDSQANRLYTVSIRHTSKTLVSDTDKVSPQINWEVVRQDMQIIPKPFGAFSLPLKLITRLLARGLDLHVLPIPPGVFPAVLTITITQLIPAGASSIFSYQFLTP